jgi:uncharacterized coiled-coil DUF342 family protein
MTDLYTEAEKWRYRANIRQGIIAKLVKRAARLENEVTRLTAALSTANTRLALYDQRERV